MKDPDGKATELSVEVKLIVYVTGAPITVTEAAAAIRPIVVIRCFIIDSFGVHPYWLLRLLPTASGRCSKFRNIIYSTCWQPHFHSYSCGSLIVRANQDDVNPPKAVVLLV